LKGDDRRARCGHPGCPRQPSEELSMAFLASIAFERTQPCLADPERMIIVGRPSRELRLVLPYLAGLPNLLAWIPGLPSVTLRRAEGFITLTDQQVLITQVEDLEEGFHLLNVLADADLEPAGGARRYAGAAAGSPPARRLARAAPDELPRLRASNVHGVCALAAHGGNGGLSGARRRRRFARGSLHDSGDAVGAPRRGTPACDAVQHAGPAPAPRPPLALPRSGLPSRTAALCNSQW